MERPGSSLFGFSNQMSDQTRLHYLFSRRRKALLSLAYQRCGSWEDAEDLVQECFARAMRVEWDCVEKADAMLATILLNMVRDYQRRRRIRCLHHCSYSDNWLETQADQSPSAEKRLSDHQLLVHAFEAIEELPPKRRSVFRMCRIEGMSHSAIAKATGMTKGAIEKHMQRALQDLKQIAKKKNRISQFSIPSKKSR